MWRHVFLEALVLGALIGCAGPRTAVPALVAVASVESTGVGASRTSSSRRSASWQWSASTQLRWVESVPEATPSISAPSEDRRDVSRAAPTHCDDPVLCQWQRNETERALSRIAGALR